MVEVLEMDELYWKTRVWTAVDRGKMRITAFGIGSGKSSVLIKLIDRMSVLTGIFQKESRV